MRRLLVLFHDPYHLRADEARAWLEREVAEVLSRDQIHGGRLTRLGGASSQAAGGFDWLLELGVGPGAEPGSGGAAGDLVADLRLLGMRPLVAVADDRDSVDLEPR